MHNNKIMGFQKIPIIYFSFEQKYIKSKHLLFKKLTVQIIYYIDLFPDPFDLLLDNIVYLVAFF